VQGRQGIEGTGRLWSRCPSAVKLVLLFSSFNSWCCIYVGRSSWHVNLVLFCFDGGQAPQRCLISKFMSSIKCFGLLPQVHAQQEQAFLVKPKF